jgi:hypothetical protein
VTPTSIRLTVVFDTKGTYGFAVTNDVGELSNTAPLTAF